MLLTIRASLPVAKVNGSSHIVDAFHTRPTRSSDERSTKIMEEVRHPRCSDRRDKCEVCMYHAPDHILSLTVLMLYPSDFKGVELYGLAN